MGVIDVPQILFIETDDLRDRPEEIMPMVHKHIGEMIPKTFSPGMSTIFDRTHVFLRSAAWNSWDLCGIVAANGNKKCEQIQEIKKIHVCFILLVDRSAFLFFFFVLRDTMAFFRPG